MKIILDKSWILFVGVWMLLCVAIWAVVMQTLGMLDVDMLMYRLMAQGCMSEVVHPYANRMLHPLIVRGLMVCGMSLECAFRSISIGLLGVLVATLLVLLREVRTTSSSDIWSVPIIFSPVLCLYVNNAFLPDLLVTTLTAIFFVLLSRQKIAYAVAMIFLLQVARESTIVLAGVFAALLCLRRQWRMAVGVAIAVGLGTFTVAWLARDAAPNIHHMGTLPYMISKVISNGMYNIFGVTLWSDVYAQTLPHFYPNAPLWRWPLPVWLSVGVTREVGVYSIHATACLRTLGILLTSFGLLPIVAWQVRRQIQFKTMPLAIQLALCGGVLYFILMPFTGRSLERLIGYAWPAFWFATPYLFQYDASFERMSVVRKMLWSVAHMILVWSVPVVSRLSGLI